MERYDVERMIEEKTSVKVSLNNRINQCGFCGDTAQKVCWSCFNDSVEILQDQIDVLKRQVKVLMVKNGIKMEATT